MSQLSAVREVLSARQSFKDKAEETNPKIRWGEAERFWQVQTSLAEIVTQLDALALDPTTENMKKVTKAIEDLPNDKKTKYKEALDDLQSVLGKTGKDVAQKEFQVRKEKVESMINELDKHPQAGHVAGVIKDCRDTIQTAVAASEESNYDTATQALDLAESSCVKAKNFADCRAEVLPVLEEVLQALHRVAGIYGGLKKLMATDVKKYPKSWQDNAGKLKKLGIQQQELATALKTPVYDDPTINGFRSDAAKLKRDACSGYDRMVRGKQDESAEAAETAGLSEEVQNALRGMAAEWQKIKITDQPNPYGGEEGEKKLKKEVTDPELLEMYAPGNRYIHVDGDEFVQGSKATATDVAKKILETNIDDKVIREKVRQENETKFKEQVTKEIGARARSDALDTARGLWYCKEAPKLLKDKGLADRLAGEDFSVLEELSSEERKLIESELKKYLESEAAENIARKGVDEAVGKEVDKMLRGEFQKAKKKAIKENSENPDLNAVPDFWMEQGKGALKAAYGRCFSSAGAAIYMMAMNPAFDSLTLESVGAVNYDHHFVLVGRSGGDVGSTTPPAIDSNTLVVDVWQANQADDIPPATPWSNFTYKEETLLKVFCVLKPGDRKALRERCNARDA